MGIRSGLRAIAGGFLSLPPGPIRLVPKTKFGKIIAGSVGLTTISAITYYKIQKIQASAYLEQMRKKRVVAISGCDSGLGLAMAFWAGKMGYKILAGCLKEDGPGAKYLKTELGDSCKVVELDVTKAESLANFREVCDALMKTLSIKTDEKIQFWALIPNAAVGCFGEYFWQTSEQVKQTVDVSFWGTINLTSAFKTLLLQDKSRVVVVSGDCADYPLPGLAIYSAAKAAIQAWASSLRREVAKYGVTVVAFQPGSFPEKSRFFSKQAAYYEEMKADMPPDELEFYGDFFHTVNRNVINNFCLPDSEPNRQPIIAPFDDKKMRGHFVNVLEGGMENTQLVTYDPFYNRISHFFLRNAPTKYADKWLNRFLKFPEWKEPQGGFRIKSK